MAHNRSKNKKQIHYSLLLFMVVCCLFFLQCEPDIQDMTPFEVAKKFLYSDRSAIPQVDFFGKTVLALYKSSDGQTALDNEIRTFITPVLSDLGFTVKYWDIDEAIPSLFDLGGVRAVVSWYRGGVMQDPESYVAFFNQTITSGRKFIVLDNFGAYEYKTEEENKYVDPALINLALGKLGIWYLGDWTDDPDVISITHKTPEIVEAGGKQDAVKSAFYYRFTAVDKDLRVYLSLNRTDQNLDPSPVVVSNRNGGFILSRYIYHIIDGTPQILIDFEEFLLRSLFCSAESEHIALLTDMNDLEIARIVKYVYNNLQRIDLDVSLIPKTQFLNLTPYDLRQYTGIGLFLKDAEHLNPKLLSFYLAEGGSLASFIGGFFPTFAPLFKASPIELSEVRSGTGYTIKSGFAFSEGAVIRNEITLWKTGNITPESDAVILGTDLDGNIPLVWSGQVEKGRVIVWNWNGFLGGNLMGLIVESFLYIRPVGAALTLGFGHMFIDDWPLPMYNAVKEPIAATDTEFYTTVWWPDMQEILGSRNIPYSTYLIFNYNAIVEPPFTGSEFFIADNMASVRMAQELLALGSEMCFHGYNHMSLTREETEVNLNKWPSVENMIASLEQGRNTWIRLFGDHTLPFAYVAVNNIISEDGVIALHRVFPSIKIISALHWGIGEERYTPIGPHPVLPEVYYLPRITYGYQNKAIIRELTVSGMNGPGIFSHFVHPDDVYDPYRSDGKNWQQLKREFQEILEYVKAHYPWLQWLSIRDAYTRLLEYDNAPSTFTWKDQTLTVATQPGIRFRVRPNNYRLSALEGAKILYSYKNMPYLVLEATAKTARLQFTPR